MWTYVETQTLETGYLFPPKTDMDGDLGTSYKVQGPAHQKSLERRNPTHPGKTCRETKLRFLRKVTRACLTAEGHTPSTWPFPATSSECQCWSPQQTMAAVT